jgi:pimeloyl-ACP methyl ester carboxylesterase
MPGYYPIIYVRGFAFSDGEIDETSDDPTNGFNLGATHARQGRGERVLKFRFPGPFVRLMTEHGYTDSIAGETDSVEFVPDPIRTLWIYRYYEDYADTFGGKGLPGRPEVEDLAWKLNLFINTVIDQTYEGAPKVIPRKVILVAHSMGGLICRSMIAQVLKGEAKTRIDKFVTYGTPHGGIELSRIHLSDFFRGAVGYHGLDNFTPQRMFEYLNPALTNREGKTSPETVKYDDKFDRRKMELLDPENVLCIVGTNPADYEVWRGWSRRVLGGPASDGLVQIKNAWVNAAHRVDIHCSHSGRYGIVNSNQGYQAMQRFLFGEWRGVVDLVLEKPIDPDDGGGGSPGGGGGGGIPKRGGPRGGPGGAAHLLDVECSLGRQSLALSSRTAEHLNALELGGRAQARLHVFHLMESDLEEEEKQEVDPRTKQVRRSFRIKLTLRLRHDRYDADEVLTLSDVLMEQPVEVRVTLGKIGAADAEVRYLWPNTIRWPKQELMWQVASREHLSHVIPIPPGRSVDTWGNRARLYLTFKGWNADGTEGESEERIRWIDERKEEIKRKKRRKQMEERVGEPVGAD